MAFGNKSDTPSFIVERKMYLKQSDYYFLEKIMNVCNKMYNTGVKHYLTVLNTFHSDVRFLSAFNSIKELFAQIQDLTAKVVGLDKRITELEKENKKLDELKNNTSSTSAEIKAQEKIVSQLTTELAKAESQYEKNKITH